MWQKLVEDLKEQGVKSPYLERLDIRLKAYPKGRHSGVQSLQIEILQEMVQSLGNAEDSLNVKLLQIDLAGKTCDKATTQEQDEKLCKQFNALREEVVRSKWEFIVQRETMGFYHTPELDRLYPIPGPRQPTIAEELPAEGQDASTEAQQAEQSSPAPGLMRKLLRAVLGRPKKSSLCQTCLEALRASI